MPWYTYAKRKHTKFLYKVPLSLSKSVLRYAADQQLSKYGKWRNVIGFTKLSLLEYLGHLFL